MKLRLENEKTFILETRDERASTKQALVRLGGRKRGKLWVFPRSMLVFDLIQLRFPQLDISDDSLKPVYSDEYAGAREWGFPIKVETPVVRPHPKWSDLYEFQKEAVDFLLSNPHRGSLLGLSPGLGKTAVSLIASEILGAKKILVISILSLLSTWERQVRAWRSDNPKVAVCWGTPPPDDAQIVIANYDTVCGTQAVTLADGRTVRKGLVKNSFDKFWDLVIIDESILVKNRQAARSKVIESVCRKAGKVWELSGSAISKYADDLYMQLRIIEPQTFTSYWRFVDLTCETEDSLWGPVVSGTREDVNVQHLLRDFYFVRHQRDVLNLPPLLPETIYVPLSAEQASLYQSIEEDFVAELGNGEELDVTSRMAQMTRLLQVASNSINIGGPNASSKGFTLLEMAISGLIEKPCLIWVHWVPGAIALEKEMRSRGLNVDLVIGGMPDVDDRIQKYINGETDYLLLSMTVGKYGHTLTNTKTVIYFDKIFDMDAYIQSMYRVQRIGLDHPVPVYSLVAQKTIDEIEIMNNLSTKAVDVSRITNADLLLLMKTIRGT